MHWRKFSSRSRWYRLPLPLAPTGSHQLPPPSRWPHGGLERAPDHSLALKSLYCGRQERANALAETQLKEQVAPPLLLAPTGSHQLPPPSRWPRGGLERAPDPSLALKSLYCGLQKQAKAEAERQLKEQMAPPLPLAPTGSDWLPPAAAALPLASWWTRKGT